MPVPMQPIHLLQLSETQPMGAVQPPALATSQRTSAEELPRPTPSTGDDGYTPEGAELLRRAPSGYLWNQAFSFWTFFALFLHSLVVARALSVDENGTFELIKTPAVLGVYLVALGLDSAGSVYLPRAFAEGGARRAVAVAFRLIALRLGAVVALAVVLLWQFGAIADLLAALNAPGADTLQRVARDPAAPAHLAALAGYVVAVGMGNLLASLLTALMRTRIIFIVGGLGQGLTIALAWILVVFFHAGADGAMWALTIPNAILALVYLVVLFRTLGLRAAPIGEGVTVGMLRLGGAAWLSDLANGSLVKSLAVAQLTLLIGLAGVALSQQTAVAFFTKAYELGDGATFLLVNGLGGVGLAVLAAAYVGRNRAHLATAWRTISKIQVLLGVPLLAFLIPHAGGIIVALYGSAYAPVGALLGLYLALSAITRLAGGGAHSAALYVLSRSRWVVIASWLGLGVIAGLDILLIPRFGVLGALVAVGVARIVAELLQLVVAQRALGRPYPIGFMLRVLLALVPGVIFGYLWRPTSLVMLFVAGLGFVALFLGGLLLIRPLDAEDGALLDQVKSPLRTLLQPLVARRRGAAIPMPARD